VHWLVDRRLLASCDPGERIFYEPERGRHRLDCVDDQGRSHTVYFVVR
jgi:membrane carboxypeptidase/penicillin-binding protein PbpC